MDRKKKKGLGILAKLILMCALPIICADVILAVYSINALQHSHGQQGCKVYPKKSESFQSSCYCLLVCYILGQWENE